MAPRLYRSVLAWSYWRPSMSESSSSSIILSNKLCNDNNNNKGRRTEGFQTGEWADIRGARGEKTSSVPKRASIYLPQYGGPNTHMHTLLGVSREGEE